jgi:RNA polymerase sigma-70 factor (ECF subfamily)
VEQRVTEKEIIEKCKKGDEAAFDELVERHQSKVINMCYGMLSDREDAYDAAQEVFLRVYRHIGSFKGQSSLSTWIYRIVVNVCSDALRKRGKTIVTSLSEEDGDKPVLEIADDSPSPDEAAQRNETVEMVRAAIAKLKDEYREVVLLCDIEGMSYDEAAEAIGCPMGTVKSRLNRARKSLRKILSEKRELFL